MGDHFAMHDAAGPDDGLVLLFDLQPHTVEWLWPGRVAIGKLTLLVGDPGVGKSYITLDMAARVSRGRPWPDGKFEGEGLRVESQNSGPRHSTLVCSLYPSLLS